MIRGSIEAAFNGRSLKYGSSRFRWTIYNNRKRFLQSAANTDVNENNLLVKPDFQIDKKFIPMTRRTLIRKVSKLNYLVKENELQMFTDFTQALEKALSRSYRGMELELKQLYDPLNPDKETIVAQHHRKKDLLDNEFLLLEKLAGLLRKANFTEIPRYHLLSLLDEHPSYEGVHVEVDIKKYDVLRAWVLSEDMLSTEKKGFARKLMHFINTRLFKWPEAIPIYRRVVLAIRTKKESKLLLKAFKDIPKDGIEYFIPVGRITMSKFDKGFLATTITVGALSVLVKVISSLIEYHVHWTYAVGGVTLILALKSWNAYKNKINKYLAKHSDMLYFKSIANNRALINLIVDRAEDEIFKSSLIAYLFINHENSLKEIVSEDGDIMKQITTTDLQEVVEKWMKTRFDLDIHFNPHNAIAELKNLGILRSRRIGENTHLMVLPLEEALSRLPIAEGDVENDDTSESLVVDEIDQNEKQHSHNPF